MRAPMEAPVRTVGGEIVPSDDFVTRTLSAILDTLVNHDAVAADASRVSSSIDIDWQGDAFEVSINTREENRDRAERILTGSPLGNDLRHAGEQAADFVQANRSLAVDLAALALQPDEPTLRLVAKEGCLCLLASAAVPDPERSSAAGPLLSMAHTQLCLMTPSTTAIRQPFRPILRVHRR